MFVQKRILSLTIIIFFSFFSFAQESRSVIDSLLNELKKADNNSKIEILNSLSMRYWDFSLDSSFYFANEALNLGHIEQNKQGISNAYNRIGNVYTFQNEHEKALEFYQKSLDIRLEIGYSKGISNIYNNIAIVYFNQNQLGIALDYYYKALKESQQRNDKNDIAAYYSSVAVIYYNLNDYKNAIKNFTLSMELAKELNNEIGLARIYNQLGNIYVDISGYEEALSYFLDALEIFEQHDNKAGVSMLYNNLGIVYQRLKENNKALEYYQKALSMDRASGNKEGQASALNNIGIAYDNKGDKEKALDYYNQALSINKELGIKDGISTALNNIGLIYLDLGDYKKAYSNLLESTNISRELNDRHGLSNNYNNLANLFLQQKNYTEAQKYLGMAAELAKKTNAKDFLVESYELYSKLYGEQGNYKKSLEYYKLYSELNDSIFEITNSNKIAELKVKFDTEYLEAENEILKKDNEIHLLELERQKNIKNYWIGFSILILALAILGFNQVRLKKKTNVLLESKNDLLKEANQKLMESENSLKELNATKDKFFSIIAHDLKNPFQSLLGFSEALYNNYNELESEDIIEYSKLIFESSQNLFNLLSNLLQWSKSQLGSINISPQKINLYDSLEDILSLHRVTADSKNIHIKNLIDEKTEIIVDKHVISTILRNLISNAIKFTNKGGEIIISSHIENNSVKVSVKDNGKGIHPEDMPKLFKINEEFSTKGTENESGTGLGLILCKELITQCDGEIHVDSEPGKGSNFTFVLPLESVQ